MLQTIYIVHCRSEKVIKVIKIILRKNNQPSVDMFHAII